MTRSNSWTNVSPRFVIDYHFAPDVMTYASATYGYKAGGFNSVEIGSHFSPETIQSYEGGLKSDWLNHTLRVNLSLYYYIYDNFQSIALAPVQNSIVPPRRPWKRNSRPTPSPHSTRSASAPSRRRRS